MVWLHGKLGQPWDLCKNMNFTFCYLEELASIFISVISKMTLRDQCDLQEGVNLTNGSSLRSYSAVRDSSSCVRKICTRQYSSFLLLYLKPFDKQTCNPYVVYSEWGHSPLLDWDPPGGTGQMVCRNPDWYGLVCSVLNGKRDLCGELELMLSVFLLYNVRPFYRSGDLLNPLFSSL